MFKQSTWPAVDVRCGNPSTTDSRSNRLHRRIETIVKGGGHRQIFSEERGGSGRRSGLDGESGRWLGTREVEGTVPSATLSHEAMAGGSCRATGW
jgi:hypothetical protein